LSHASHPDCRAIRNKRRRLLECGVTASGALRGLLVKTGKVGYSNEAAERVIDDIARNIDQMSDETVSKAPLALAVSRLANKTALIIGGTSGIGLETARQFVAEGARVAVTGSSAASVEKARIELGDSVIVVQSDAGDVDGQNKVASQIDGAFGHLDILFVNAGVAQFGPVESWSEADFDKSFATNVKGPYFLIQALLPIFSKGVSIVLNTSINAHIGMPNSSVYSLTKGALLTLAKTLSGELVGRGIRVNAVCPGPIATRFTESSACPRRT